MVIKSQKDFYSGLLFMIVGTAFALGANTYEVGSGANMGPGYFPLILGVILTILGGIIIFKATVSRAKNGDKVGTLAWKPMFFIILANLAFGACIEGLPAIGLPPLGLIVGIFILTFTAAYAGDEFRKREIVILAIILSILSYVAFIWLLDLQFPAWPLFVKT